MPYADYAQNKIQDAVHRGQTLGAPATKHYALLKCSNGILARGTAYALNATVIVLTTDTTYHLYKVTTGGTSHATVAPTYTGGRGEVIVDGGATLTEQSITLDAGGASVYAMEVSASGYNRIAVTASLATSNGTHGNTTGASSGIGGVITNATAVTFGTPGANWNTSPELIWAWAWFDSGTASAGNLWEWGPLGTPQSILSGQSGPSFAGGALTSILGA